MTDNQYGGSKKTIVRLRLGFHCQLRLAELEQSFIQGSLPIDQIRDDFERVVWPNAKAMRAWCVGQAKHDVRAAILCSKLAGCAGYLLDQEHGRQLLIQWREDAVEAIAVTCRRAGFQRKHMPIWYTISWGTLVTWATYT